MICYIMFHYKKVVLRKERIPLVNLKRYVVYKNIQSYQKQYMMEIECKQEGKFWYGNVAQINVLVVVCLW